ncbi:MAG TPA: hypothetical protein VII34_12015 [Pyrinomonadaceae bacterium]
MRDSSGGKDLSLGFYYAVIESRKDVQQAADYGYIGEILAK